MIDYISIKNTLVHLDSEFTSSTDTQMSVLLSKLGVLELCGWIETSVDIMLYEYVSSHIIDNDCKKGIEKIIKKNNGFHYDNNLFPLFCSVLGINNWENVLDVVSPTDFFNLKSITHNYTEERNKAAHTDTPVGTTRSYKAPSDVVHDFSLIKPAIQTLENQIKAL